MQGPWTASVLPQGKGSQLGMTGLLQSTIQRGLVMQGPWTASVLPQGKGSQLGMTGMPQSTIQRGLVMQVQGQPQSCLRGSDLSWQ